MTMVMTGDVTPSTPGWEAYTSNREAAGPFENQILYSMCRVNPAHNDPYVTAGKITAIGRIYAAAPERGAGSGRETGSLASSIALRLENSRLDTMLDAIAFADRFSDANLASIVEVHQLLVDEIAQATRDWSIAADDEGWSPRNQPSFSSKYLHFHRPNMFPIMDSYAKAGLSCAGLTGSFDTYERFCAGFARHAERQKPEWTPRSIDTDLVIRGRAHLDRADTSCRECGMTFVRRSRKKKPAKMDGSY